MLKKPLITMKYVTPYKYAKLCGVSTQAIYQRIKSKLLPTIQIPAIDGEMKHYVDIEQHPPARLKNKF